MKQMVEMLAELSELRQNTSCCQLYTSLHVMHVLASLTSDCPVCSVLAQLHLPNCMNETVLSVCVCDTSADRGIHAVIQNFGGTCCRPA